MKIKKKLKLFDNGNEERTSHDKEAIPNDFLFHQLLLPKSSGNDRIAIISDLFSSILAA